MASQIILPKLTYEMQEGRILEWLCAEGQDISAGQSLFVVETDKAATEVPADQAGVLLKILVPAGVDVAVGSIVAWVGLAGEVLPDASSSGQNPARQKLETTPAVVVGPPSGAGGGDANQKEAGEIMATPVAKRMARELGVDLKDVAQYTGKLRVREADLQAYIDSLGKPQLVSAPQPVQPAMVAFKEPPSGPAEKPVVGEPTEFQLIQPNPVQRAMAAHLSQSALIPQAAAGCELELTQFDNFREQLQSGWEKKFGFRLTYTHLIAALTSRAILEHPLLNASWTDQGIRLYQTVNLGIAMASQRGQLVPVVQRAHERSLGNLAGEIVRLQTAINNNRLSPQDMQGGTMTLTNVGMLGIELSIPVLNPPQSAILGVGARRTRLILDNGQVKSIAVISVTLVVDHRMVDGSVQGAFFKTFKEFIENPALILTA